MKNISGTTHVRDIFFVFNLVETILNYFEKNAENHINPRRVYGWEKIYFGRTNCKIFIILLLYLLKEICVTLFL